MAQGTITVRIDVRWPTDLLIDPETATDAEIDAAIARFNEWMRQDHSDAIREIRRLCKALERQVRASGRRLPRRSSHRHRRRGRP